MTLEAFLLDIFSTIPSWLAVIIMAALPIVELRLAIPLAILKPPYGFGMDPIWAFSLSVIGNMLPVIPLLLYLEPVSNYLRRWKTWDRFFPGFLQGHIVITVKALKNTGRSGWRYLQVFL